MKKELSAYSAAFQAHHKALRREIKSSLEVKLTRNRLEMATSDLRSKEREMLEDAENVVMHGGGGSRLSVRIHGPGGGNSGGGYGGGGGKSGPVTVSKNKQKNG